MKAINFNNFQAVSSSTDGLILNTFLMRLQQDFASAEVVESLKKMPGDFKVMIHVVPNGHGSTEAQFLSAVRQELENTPGLSIDFDKVDPHHFIVHFVNASASKEDRVHPVHALGESDNSDLDQYVLQAPAEDIVVSPAELDMSSDDSDLDFYTVNTPLIEVSADSIYAGEISNKKYLHTFDDLTRNYRMVSADVAMQYNNVSKSETPDRRFELWSNLNDIICVVKDNLTNKYWELKS